MPLTVNEWDEVRFIEHDAARPIVFGGFVQSVRVTSWATGGRFIEVEVVGYGILLDRKVVPYLNISNSGSAPNYLGGAWAQVVNGYGGRISALQPTTVNGATDETHTVSRYGGWVPAVVTTDQDTAVGPTTLRGACDFLGEQSASAEGFRSLPGGIGFTFYQVGAIYWVDASARLHAHPNDLSVIDAAHIENQYDGNCPVAISESTSAGQVRAESVEYERENTDLVTRAYVIGGIAAGTGFTDPVIAPPAATGDLEVLVNDENSTTPAMKQSVGEGAVRQTAGTQARATATVNSDLPVDFRPGQKLTVTNTALGLSAAAFRITQVSIDFRSTTARTYAVGFGGTLPPPSMARRQGRFVVMSRGPRRT